jgi:hypothetical protein
LIDGVIVSQMDMLDYSAKLRLWLIDAHFLPRFVPPASSQPSSLRNFARTVKFNAKMPATRIRTASLYWADLNI